MKIIGFTQIDGRCEMLIKGDSAMLNGRKPMFMPDWTDDLRMTPCLILRVSRLGKNISPKFAGRYYDAVAPGIDFLGYDTLQQAKQQQTSWTQATAFDFSLAIGDWTGPGELLTYTIDEQPVRSGHWLISPEEAIHRASLLTTLRQGDLIYIGLQDEYLPVQAEQVIQARTNETEKLYCKIK